MPFDNNLAITLINTLMCLLINIALTLKTKTHVK